MNLKKINKLFIFLFFFIISSCKSIDNIKSKNVTNDYIESEKIENSETINLEKNIYISDNIDNYTPFQNFSFKKNEKFTKIFEIKNTININLTINPLKIFFIDDKIYSLNKNSNFEVYDLNSEKKISSYELNYDQKNEFSYPSSIAHLNNLFYVAYSDGNIICFNSKAEIKWKRIFNDVLKTSIKLHNSNLIILLSNKIISLNTLDGSINWEFLYENNNSISIYGGSLISKNHLLYFTLPNGEFGQINTIVGEKIDSLFSNIGLNTSKFNYVNNIHNFNSAISIFDNNNFLTTIDLNNNQFLVNKYKITNTTSHLFYNNSIFTLNDQRILKVYNILNNYIFWNIDMKSYISKNEKIINVINSNDNNLLLFFSNGKIIEINSINGKITFEYKLNINKIHSIYNYKNLLIINQLNGKTKILKQ